MSGPTPRVAALIVNYRTPELALECVDSLAAERARLPGLRVMIVDGGSADGSAERMAAALEGQGSWATLLPLSLNGGFGYANNQGMLAFAASDAPPDYILLINPDARVLPGAIAMLAELLDAHPRAGAVGARLEHEDGSLQGSAFTFPSIPGEFCRGARTAAVERLLGQKPTAIHSDTALRVPWVTGAAVMLRAAALREIGLFDDGFFLYFEETELMHRLTGAGWEVWHEPAARVVHLAGKATQLRDPATGRLLPKRLPRYWYDARRRYFVRTAGLGGALAAGLAWLAGRLLWQARCTLTSRTDDDPSRTTRDLVTYALFPRARDRRTAPLPCFDDPPGLPPAWMDAKR